MAAGSRGVKLIVRIGEASDKLITSGGNVSYFRPCRIWVVVPDLSRRIKENVEQKPGVLIWDKCTGLEEFRVVISSLSSSSLPANLWFPLFLNHHYMSFHQADDDSSSSTHYYYNIYPASHVFLLQAFP